jgi:hypothetical protein
MKRCIQPRSDHLHCRRASDKFSLVEQDKMCCFFASPCVAALNGSEALEGENGAQPIASMLARGGIRSRRRSLS